MNLSKAPQIAGAVMQSFQIQGVSHDVGAEALVIALAGLTVAKSGNVEHMQIGIDSAMNLYREWCERIWNQNAPMIQPLGAK